MYVHEVSNSSYPCLFHTLAKKDACFFFVAVVLFFLQACGRPGYEAGFPRIQYITAEFNSLPTNDAYMCHELP